MTQRRISGSGLWLVVFVGGLLGLAGVGVLGYFYFFTNQLGWGGPDILRWQVGGDFRQISNSQVQWTLSYHSGQETQFRGIVRHASQVRMGAFPLITHDVLVTTGDFADGNTVATQVDVFRHHFFWQSHKADNQPRGTINLLHTVPLNQALYQQLLRVHIGDQIMVTGYEIDKIIALDLQTKHELGSWQDEGCDSILVTGVTWLKP